MVAIMGYSKVITLLNLLYRFIIYRVCDKYFKSSFALLTTGFAQIYSCIMYGGPFSLKR